jgi:uncharacterized tellurite resistance protein B-like protein
MKNLLQKLFNLSPQSRDGLAQAQREAMVDVLLYCMYADNRLALKEDRILADAVGQFSWDPKVSYDAYAARSIANARALKESESPATRAEFLSSVAARLETRAAKLRTLGLCRKIFQADGDVSAAEQELLRDLQKHLA